MFQLQSTYAPSGDQASAIESLAMGLQRGDGCQTLLGVTGSGKTFTMANVIAKTGRPALVLAPNKTLAAQLYAEFKEFFPKNAVEYFVSYYDYYQPEAYVPAKDLYIEKDSSINEQIEQMRLSATKSLLERKDVVLVATVSSIYGLGDPKNYLQMILFLKKGHKLPRKYMIEQLVKMQYVRNDEEFLRGTFRVRGDVLDIFPSEQAQDAIRVEMFDDEIDAIFKIDPIGGKKIEALDAYNVFPATHYAIPEEQIKRAIESIKKELKERVAILNNQNKGLEAQRLLTRTNFDLEMLEEVGFCKGIENYSWHLTGGQSGQTPCTLFDYLPENALLFLDESHLMVPQIGAMYKGDRARKENLVNFGFRLPSALDNRPLRFDEFEKKMPQCVFVSATPAEYEMTKSAQVVEQVIRPTGIVDPEIEIRPTEFQVEDAIKEIADAQQRGTRVLVTTLTKKMSEKIADYLKEQGIEARYLHSDIDNVERIEILKGLREGDFNALIGINLLREGLDLPEVDCVLVLDADKEGFLRSERSLIQTIGRAARNPNGRVILYADKKTDSMHRAMEETARRRGIQKAFNAKHGIFPTLAVSKIKNVLGVEKLTDEKSVDLISTGQQKGALLLEEFSQISREKLEKQKKQLEKQMQQYAKDLKFEEALACRKKIEKITAFLLL